MGDLIAHWKDKLWWWRDNYSF